MAQLRCFLGVMEFLWGAMEFLWGAMELCC